MARINIDDSIYKDARFLKLCFKLQSIDTALGAMVRVWSVAQKWYLIGNQMIPISEWGTQDLNSEVISVGLAVLECDGKFVRVDGADEQFGWLLQRVEAGRKGGKSKAVAVAKRSLAVAKQSVANESLLSPTPTLTPSLEQKEKKEGMEIIISSVNKEMLMGIEEAWDEWNQTLEHFKIPPKKISPDEEGVIYRAIRRITLEGVILAIKGKRVEKGFDGYDPAKNLSLSKLFSKDKDGANRWEKHMYAGAAETIKEKKMTQEEIDQQALGVPKYE